MICLSSIHPHPPDVTETLQRRYCNDLIMLLKLSSGNWACLNSAREICSIKPTAEEAIQGWFKPQQKTRSFLNVGDILTEAGL